MELPFDLLGPQENALNAAPPMQTEKRSVAILARSYHCRERLDSPWKQLRWGVGLGQAESSGEFQTLVHIERLLGRIMFKSSRLVGKNLRAVFCCCFRFCLIEV